MFYKSLVSEVVNTWENLIDRVNEHNVQRGSTLPSRMAERVWEAQNKVLRQEAKIISKDNRPNWFER